MIMFGGIFGKLGRKPYIGRCLANCNPVCKPRKVFQYHTQVKDLKSSSKFKYIILAGLSSFGGAQIYLYKQKILADSQASQDLEHFGQPIDGLPTYSLDDVSLHSSIDGKVWVTFRNGVYDITDLLEKHPGGYDKVLLAAGSSLEPFWQLYGFHYSINTLKWLEKYRIGNLKVGEQYVIRESDDAYGDEPKRHPALQAASVKPFNAEPPAKLICDSFITPNDLFYVRNHLPVPVVDQDSYELSVQIEELNKEFTFSFDDLKKFPKHTITASIQCAGNRRSEMKAVKNLKGLDWKQGAIGNATWSGARLIDVLQHCGFEPYATKAKHVQFEGLDTDVSNIAYGASVPIDKVVNPYGDVILAYEMNGVPIPRDHGFPVRVIVPGIVGARNVKWLGRIIVSDKESDSHFQQSDYKGFCPSVDWDNVDFSKSPAIQELPVTSAICSPENGETVRCKDGKLKLKGYAWSGGGRSIVRLDYSLDEGKNWNVARLTHQPDEAPRAWGWTLWEALVDVEANEEVEVWVKATDSSYNTQPETFHNIWNLRGVLGNAYHKIKVKTMIE